MYKWIVVYSCLDFDTRMRLDRFSIVTWRLDGAIEYDRHSWINETRSVHVSELFGTLVRIMQLIGTQECIIKWLET